MKLKTLRTIRLVSILSMLGGLVLGIGLLLWLSFLVWAWTFLYSAEIMEQAFYEDAVEKRKEKIFGQFLDKKDDEDKRE